MILSFEESSRIGLRNIALFFWILEHYVLCAKTAYSPQIASVNWNMEDFCVKQIYLGFLFPESYKKIYKTYLIKSPNKYIVINLPIKNIP